MSNHELPTSPSIQEREPMTLTRRGRIVRNIGIATLIGASVVLVPQVGNYFINRIGPALDAQCFDANSPKALLQEVQDAGIDTTSLQDGLFSHTYTAVAATVAENGTVVNLEPGTCPQQ